MWSKRQNISNPAFTIGSLFSTLVGVPSAASNSNYWGVDCHITSPFVVTAAFHFVPTLLDLWQLRGRRHDCMVICLLFARFYMSRFSICIRLYLQLWQLSRCRHAPPLLFVCGEMNFQTNFHHPVGEESSVASSISSIEGKILRNISGIEQFFFHEFYVFPTAN